MFKHYIFTRFNLLDSTTDIYNNPMIKDPNTWMQHRIKLFEQYTLPGMQKQTNQDFIWVLAFSRNTPLDVISKFDYCDNIRIIYEYPKDWIQRLSPQSDYLITSRIDNDDYYDPEFIDIIQANADTREEIIDVDYVQLDHVTGIRYNSLRTTANSPFLSLVEQWDVDKVKTCFHCSHTKMIQHFKASKINLPLATMVIHDRNISNEIVGDQI